VTRAVATARLRCRQDDDYLIADYLIAPWSAPDCTTRR
jgi:hypothetical protein